MGLKDSLGIHLWIIGGFEMILMLLRSPLRVDSNVEVIDYWGQSVWKLSF